jgi:hypothetical protein
MSGTTAGLLWLDFQRAAEQVFPVQYSPTDRLPVTESCADKGIHALAWPYSLLSLEGLTSESPTQKTIYEAEWFTRKRYETKGLCS